MSKRGLYPTLSTKQRKNSSKNYMNFLQYADGNNSIEKISKKINLNLYLTKNFFKTQIKKFN